MVIKFIPGSSRVRLAETEEKQILDLMREKGEDNFSDFLRKSLLLSDGQKQTEKMVQSLETAKVWNKLAVMFMKY